MKALGRLMVLAALLGGGMNAAWSEEAPANDATPKQETALKPAPETLLPEGTMQPVTLKAVLQKNQELPLTLEQALKLAVGQNITVALDEERVTQQRLDAQYRLSDLLPDLASEYRQQRFVGVAQIFGGQTISIFRTTYQPQLSANYTVYTAGKNLWEIKASRQRLAAQNSLLENTRQDTLTQVALAYYTLQQAYWQRAIALQAIKEAELEVQLNQARLDSGVGIRLDVLQAQTFLSTQRQALLTAENRIAQAAQRLSNLLNLDIGMDIIPASLESTVAPIIPEETPFVHFVNQSKKHHPRLQALKQLQAASQTDIRAAVADLFPKIEIIAYLNGTGPELSNLGLTRFAGVHATTNLLDNLGLGKPLQIKAAQSQARLAALTVTEAEKRLEENLSNAMTDLKTLESQIQLARQTLDYAKQTYEHALGRLKSGIGTNVDLENAMTRLTNARTDLANAFLNINKAQVALLSYAGLVSLETLTQGYRPDASAFFSP